jgi:hypothetical protein
MYIRCPDLAGQKGVELGLLRPKTVSTLVPVHCIGYEGADPVMMAYLPALGPSLSTRPRVCGTAGVGVLVTVVMVGDDARVFRVDVSVVPAGCTTRVVTPMVMTPSTTDSTVVAIVCQMMEVTARRTR